MRRFRSVLAACALAAMLAAGCEGGDATPTDVGEPTPTGPSPADEQGIRDPGGNLESPDPGDAAPDEQPGIETPEG